MFIFEMTLEDGTIKREFFRSEGMMWMDSVSTEEFIWKGVND